MTLLCHGRSKVSKESDSISRIIIPAKGVKSMVYVYLKQMPGYCHEMVAPNDDGSYTVIINEALSKAEQREAYSHALRHITSNHFESGEADIIEGECHAQEEGRRKI